ncbi:MAG: NAD(P)-dependent oxidoreductase [Acidimicrobiales bacterium]
MTGRCLVQPESSRASALAERVRQAGLDVVTDSRKADAVVWCSAEPDPLAEILSTGGGVRWVQIGQAGIERFVPLLRQQPETVVWTCAKEIFGPPVAEMVLGLLITGFRRLDLYAAARRWEPRPVRVLAGSTVVVLGAGGIARSLVRLLRPSGADVVVVSPSGTSIDGARPVRSVDTMAAVAAADAVVLALPLTAETSGMVDRRFLDAMRSTAWLVNVARGGVVVTDDLVDALRDRRIGGAALDVTDPEPLPDGHPLWALDNAIVTPHVANTPELSVRALGDRVEENARRFLAGQPLLGVVDRRAGY